MSHLGRSIGIAGIAAKIQKRVAVHTLAPARDTNLRIVALFYLNNDAGFVASTSCFWVQDFEQLSIV